METESPLLTLETRLDIRHTRSKRRERPEFLNRSDVPHPLLPIDSPRVSRRVERMEEKDPVDEFLAERARERVETEQKLPESLARAHVTIPSLIQSYLGNDELQRDQLQFIDLIAQILAIFRVTVKKTGIPLFRLQNLGNTCFINTALNKIYSMLPTIEESWVGGNGYHEYFRGRLVHYERVYAEYISAYSGSSSGREEEEMASRLGFVEPTQKEIFFAVLKIQNAQLPVLLNALSTRLSQLPSFNYVLGEQADSSEAVVHILDQLDSSAIAHVSYSEIIRDDVLERSIWENNDPSTERLVSPQNMFKRIQQLGARVSDRARRAYLAFVRWNVDMKLTDSCFTPRQRTHQERLTGLELPPTATQDDVRFILNGELVASILEYNELNPESPIDGRRLMAEFFTGGEKAWHFDSESSVYFTRREDHLAHIAFEPSGARDLKLQDLINERFQRPSSSENDIFGVSSGYRIDSVDGFAPQAITFQISRYLFGARNNSHVSAPTLLSVPIYLRGRSVVCFYQLESISDHLGASSKSGHYITRRFVFDERTNRYSRYILNDDDVSAESLPRGQHEIVEYGKNAVGYSYRLVESPELAPRPEIGSVWGHQRKDERYVSKKGSSDKSLSAHSFTDKQICEQLKSDQENLERFLPSVMSIINRFVQLQLKQEFSEIFSKEKEEISVLISAALPQTSDQFQSTPLWVQLVDLVFNFLHPHISSKRDDLAKASKRATGGWVVFEKGPAVYTGEARSKDSIPKDSRTEDSRTEDSRTEDSRTEDQEVGSLSGAPSILEDAITSVFGGNHAANKIAGLVTGYLEEESVEPSREENVVYLEFEPSGTIKQTDFLDREDEGSGIYDLEQNSFVRSKTAKAIDEMQLAHDRSKVKDTRFKKLAKKHKEKLEYSGLSDHEAVETAVKIPGVEEPLKALTFNIDLRRYRFSSQDSEDDRLRKAHILTYLKKKVSEDDEVDVFFFQELGQHEGRQVFELLSNRGFEEISGDRDKVTFIKKSKISKVNAKNITLQREKIVQRYGALIVKTKIQGKDLILVNIHLSPHRGTSNQKKRREQIRKLITYLQSEFQGIPYVIGGDTNEGEITLQDTLSELGQEEAHSFIQGDHPTHHLKDNTRAKLKITHHDDHKDYIFGGHGVEVLSSTVEVLRYRKTDKRSEVLDQERDPERDPELDPERDPELELPRPRIRRSSGVGFDKTLLSTELGDGDRTISLHLCEDRRGAAKENLGKDTVVVNAANSKASGGGVDGIIDSRFGPTKTKSPAEPSSTFYQADYLRTRRANTGIQAGEARMVMLDPNDSTSAPGGIILTVGPDFRDRSSSPNLTQLKSAYANSLQEAHEAGFRRVVFPAISSSIFKGSQPLDTIFGAAIETINEKLVQLNAEGTSIEEVYLVQWERSREIQEFRDFTEGLRAESESENKLRIDDEPERSISISEIEETQLDALNHEHQSSVEIRPREELQSYQEQVNSLRQRANALRDSDSLPAEEVEDAWLAINAAFKYIFSFNFGSDGGLFDRRIADKLLEEAAAQLDTIEKKLKPERIPTERGRDLLLEESELDATIRERDLEERSYSEEDSYSPKSSVEIRPREELQSYQEQVNFLMQRANALRESDSVNAEEVENAWLAVNAAFKYIFAFKFGSEGGLFDKNLADKLLEEAAAQLDTIEKKLKPERIPTERGRGRENRRRRGKGKKVSQKALATISREIYIEAEAAAIEVVTIERKTPRALKAKFEQADAGEGSSEEQIEAITAAISQAELEAIEAAKRTLENRIPSKRFKIPDKEIRILEARARAAVHNTKRLKALVRLKQRITARAEREAQRRSKRAVEEVVLDLRHEKSEFETIGTYSSILDREVSQSVNEPSISGRRHSVSQSRDEDLSHSIIYPEEDSYFKESNSEDLFHSIIHSEADPWHITDERDFITNLLKRRNHRFILSPMFIDKLEGFELGHIGEVFGQFILTLIDEDSDQNSPVWSRILGNLTNQDYTSAKSFLLDFQRAYYQTYEEEIINPGDDPKAKKQKFEELLLGDFVSYFAIRPFSFVNDYLYDHLSLGLPYDVYQAAFQSVRLSEFDSYREYLSELRNFLIQALGLKNDKKEESKEKKKVSGEYIADEEEPGHAIELNRETYVSWGGFTSTSLLNVYRFIKRFQAGKFRQVSVDGKSMYCASIFTSVPQAPQGTAIYFISRSRSLDDDPVILIGSQSDLPVTSTDPKKPGVLNLGLGKAKYHRKKKIKTDPFRQVTVEEKDKQRKRFRLF